VQIQPVPCAPGQRLGELSQELGEREDHEELTSRQNPRARTKANTGWLKASDHRPASERVRAPGPPVTRSREAASS